MRNSLLIVLATVATLSCLVTRADAQGGGRRGMVVNIRSVLASMPAHIRRANCFDFMTDDEILNDEFFIAWSEQDPINRWCLKNQMESERAATQIHRQEAATRSWAFGPRTLAQPLILWPLDLSCGKTCSGNQVLQIPVQKDAPADKPKDKPEDAKEPVAQQQWHPPMEISYRGR